MSLKAGTKLGPYEILSPLGAGGMGEVYLAKDTRLDRDVAIKVLPSHLTANSEFKQRFEREAKTISQLSHPNICTLHDIGNEDGIDFLVMEYLEGDTLAQRLSKRRLAIEEVLQYGIEIASALDKAHRAGIVHRDLKPGNIMLTKSGAKLLDFGLAKATPGQSGLSTTPNAVTVTEPLTGKGTIVGTFQYMAPEQLEGKEADQPTDIFAFGAVLYEMATGQRAFEGSSRASLIASIMSSQPRAISEIQPMTPPSLEYLVRTCLAKDPEDRIRTAHDVKLQLQWIAEGGSQLGVPAVVASTRRGTERIAWGLVVVGLVLSVTLGVWNLRTTDEDARTYRMNVLPPEGTTLVSIGAHAGPVVLSPDGTRMAFVARAGEDRQRIWVRSLDKFDAAPLAGTEDAERLFWSPDGRKLGFFADKKLLTIDADGGPTFSLADAPESRGGTWNQEGTILFAPNWNVGLSRVSASGGPVAMATRLDDAGEESTHRYPCFLPDGRSFLYLARRSGTGSGTGPAIVLASLDSTERRTILSAASSVTYALGHILFSRQHTLMAVQFDTNRLAIVGDPFPIAGDLLVDERYSLAIFSASQNGTIAYQTGEALSLGQLTWIDRRGEQVDLVGDPEYYQNLSGAQLSPDGTKVLFSIQDMDTGNEDVWIRDLARDMQVRFTFGHVDGRSAGSYGAVWSPEGTHVVYGSLSGRVSDLIRKPALVTGVAEMLLKGPGGFAQPRSFSPDGKLLLFEPESVETGVDILVLTLGDDKKPDPFAVSPAREFFGQFSPDGKFVAFVSDVSGRNEVYVATFPDRDGEWQVSTRGGTEPRWRSDGTELYFVDPEDWLNVTEVSFEESRFTIGTTKKLFEARRIGDTWRYDVASDGQRFLVTVPTSDLNASPIHVVVNWLSDRRNR